MALATRPDLRALELSQARSLADLRLQEALGKIDYTIGAEYRRQQGIAGKSNSLGFFFSAPLPISNRNQGEIARAGAEGQQAARQIAARRAQIVADVQSAYHEYVETRGLVVGIERDLLQPATTVRDIAAYTYRTGGSTLLELLDAQRAFTDTMQSYVEAQASLRRAIARLNTAVGDGGGPMIRTARRTIAVLLDRLGGGGCVVQPAVRGHAAELPRRRRSAGRRALFVDPKMRASITVAAVQPRDVAAVLNVAGKVQFDEDRLSRVLVPVAGQVVDLRVKLGDAVQKGQPLCAINSREAASAVGEHAESHKDLDLAEKNAAMTRGSVRSSGRIEDVAAAGAERPREGEGARRAQRRSAAAARPAKRERRWRRSPDASRSCRRSRAS